jgi:enamine deaminase RidA (YjgF/YER057c/UK114 family)
MTLERRVIGWNEQFSFSLAVEVTRADRVLFCAGQISIDEGTLTILHPGDMRGQIVKALDNIEAVLSEAGYELTDVVRLNYYTTDVDAFMGAYDALAQRLAERNCRPASTLLGVTKLAFPDVLVEIEATAVK